MRFRSILLTVIILFRISAPLTAASDAETLARLDHAERDWVCVVWHLKRGQKASAVVHCRFIVRDAPTSRRARSAAHLLEQMRYFQ